MYPFRILLAGAFVASGVHADWLLNSYAFPAPDSAEANALYGVQSYQNPSSKVDVRVADSAVSLVASVIASEGAEGYSANVGLLHPLTPDWATHDLTGLVSIDFEFRNSVAITEYLAVSFGSKAYSDEVSNAGTVYEIAVKGTALLKAGTAWKSVSLPAADLATPTWWTNIPNDFPKVEEMLKKVVNLQFAPKTTYTDAGTQNGNACSKCVTPTMPSLTLEIRKVVLVGVPSYPPPPPLGPACQRSPVTLDRAFGDTRHELGGWWFGYSDFDSTGTSIDSARGSSTMATALTAGDDFASGSIGMKARLDKKVGGTWHKYAGWAAIGANFDSGLVFKPETFDGISFHLSGTTISSSVQTIVFKVALEGVPDAVVHQALIPASMLLAAGGQDFCVSAHDLRMPSYVPEAQRVAFDPTRKIKQIAWEARITDDRNPLLDTATVDIALSDVKVYGELANVGVSRRVAVRGPSIGNSDGFLHLRGFESVASVDILSLDGRRVATFAPASRVPLRRPRGTWILSTRGRDGSVAMQPFVVVGR
jgi:hypothetical protein